MCGVLPTKTLINVRSSNIVCVIIVYLQPGRIQHLIVAHARGHAHTNIRHNTTKMNIFFLYFCAMKTLLFL